MRALQLVPLHRDVDRGSGCRRRCSALTMSPIRSGRARLRMRRAHLGRGSRTSRGGILAKMVIESTRRILERRHELVGRRRRRRCRGCARRCGSRGESGDSGGAYAGPRRACLIPCCRCARRRPGGELTLEDEEDGERDDGGDDRRHRLQIPVRARRCRGCGRACTGSGTLERR